MVQAHLAAKYQSILLRRHAKYLFVRTISLATSCSGATFDKEDAGGDLESRVNKKLDPEEDSIDPKARSAVRIRNVKYPSDNKVATKNGSRDPKTGPALRIRHFEYPPKNRAGSAVRIRYMKYLPKNETGSAVRIRYVKYLPRPVEYTLNKKITTEEDSKDPKIEPTVRILYVKYTPKFATEKDFSDRKLYPYESRRGLVRIRWQPTFTKSVVHRRRSVRFHNSENGTKPPPTSNFVNGRFPHPFDDSLMKWETLALKARHKLDIGYTTPSGDINEESTVLAPINHSSGTGLVAIKPSPNHGEPISNSTLWQGPVHSKPDFLSQPKQSLRRLLSLFRRQNPFSSRAFSSTPMSTSPESHQYRLLSTELSLHDPEDKTVSWDQNLDIRDRLRLWKPSNSDKQLQFPETGNTRYEKIYNQLRPSTDSALLDSRLTDNDSTQPIYEMGDLVDFGDSRTFLLRGDLVELSNQGSLRIELGIFIRTIGKQSQFYTASGKWIQQRPFLPKFYVPGFVQADELDPLLPFLPDKDVPEALQGIAQSFENAPPRNSGAHLIKKMLQFLKESDATYRLAASKIDNAHRLTAFPSTLRYAHLILLADTLLPSGLKKNGFYPPPVLYALHRSLSREGCGFRPQKLATHRTWGQFEISSIREVDTITAVCEDVRKYQESLVPSATENSSYSNPITRPTNFEKFITKVQGLIDDSRRSRRVTPHGTIGPVEPSTSNTSPPQASGSKTKFEKSDDQYLGFMESWCCLKTFEKQSHLHGVASTILRATGRYEGLELEQDIGWVFLQEVGAITPWENPIVFDLRLPMAGRMLSSERLHEDWDEQPVYSLRPDVFKDTRKDWGQVPVYCIDGADAKEIDDGLSIEPTTSPGEYWVHIHTADPASRIAPQSQIAKRALSMVQSTYLPERFISMLPHRIIQEDLSLAPRRNCLTFSARMNLIGDILEYKITPAIINNVYFLTPELVHDVLGSTIPVGKVITVGKDPIVNATSTLQERPILQQHEVTAEHEQNLRLLHSISVGRVTKATSRGAIDFCDSNFSVSVLSRRYLFHRMGDSPHNKQCNIDPVIRLTVGEWNPDTAVAPANLVRDLMLLGGEIAARWCHERGIPIIYRVTQSNPEQPDPTEFFRKKIFPYIKHSPKPCLEGKSFQQDTPNSQSIEDESSEYATENLPSEAQGATEIDILSRVRKGSIPIELKFEYLGKLGSVLPSTTAGPHVALGLQMFTKATSPLRRCGDLLTHWQIEAALLEEARTGKSLIGSKRKDYLPFQKSEVDDLLPHLDTRERLMSIANTAAQRVWAIQLLVRAWKFNEAPLPPTFEFIVRDVSLLSGYATGQLVYFGGLRADMNIPKWIEAENVNPKDIFEVELEDLNVYKQQIKVSGLRRNKTAEVELS